MIRTQPVQRKGRFHAAASKSMEGRRREIEPEIAMTNLILSGGLDGAPATIDLGPFTAAVAQLGFIKLFGQWLGVDMRPTPMPSASPPFWQRYAASRVAFGLPRHDEASQVCKATKSARCK